MRTRSLALRPSQGVSHVLGESKELHAAGGVKHWPMWHWDTTAQRLSSCGVSCLGGMLEGGCLPAGRGGVRLQEGGGRWWAICQPLCTLKRSREMVFGGRAEGGSWRRGRVSGDTRQPAVKRMKGCAHHDTGRIHDVGGLQYSLHSCRSPAQALEARGGAISRRGGGRAGEPRKELGGGAGLPLEACDGLHGI